MKLQTVFFSSAKMGHQKSPFHLLLLWPFYHILQPIVALISQTVPTPPKRPWSTPTSSITSLGEATRMAMPLSASLSRTSWKSRFRRDLARDRARPYGGQTHRKSVT